MVHIAADLPQFIQRRELAAYEQRLARTGYAYGADLRRAAWLAGSMIGDPLMRAVDRRWTRTVQGLEEDVLLPQRKAPPLALLEELWGLINLLRAPLPSVRLLRPELADQWPIITPLSTTKGAVYWLVIDLPRLRALSAAERTFMLGAALGHLQCDHGPIFAAHLMKHRGERIGLVRRLMGPWAKVATFSADRAGLLAVQSLTAAIAGAERQAGGHAEWMPPLPSLADRVQSLEDFDRAEVMVRRRMLSDPDGGSWTLAATIREPRRPLGLRLRDMLGKAEEDDEAEGEPKGEGEGKGEGKAPEASSSEGEAKAAAPPKPPPLDPDHAARLNKALAEAWSLARCDSRLTRRLKLL